MGGNLFVGEAPPGCAMPWPTRAQGGHDMDTGRQVAARPGHDPGGCEGLGEGLASRHGDSVGLGRRGLQSETSQAAQRRTAPPEKAKALPSRPETKV